jgi:uncharacterized NAD(P)/FAD-binding protein YdhS
MDARGVQRTLEKIRGMAESAEHVGDRMAESIDHESRLSDNAKQELKPLYREHSLRLMLLYAQLGARICEAISEEAEDDTARGLVELFRANFASMRDRAEDALHREIGSETKLG